MVCKRGLHLCLKRQVAGYGLSIEFIDGERINNEVLPGKGKAENLLC